MLLLIVVLISSILVVHITHLTRTLTTASAQLVLDKDILDIEWRHLIIEENTLGDHSRVERIATGKLKMQHVHPLQEHVVFHS